MIQAQFEKTFEGWRNLAREYAQHLVRPEDIQWSDESYSLFTTETSKSSFSETKIQVKVPQEFLKLAESIAYARDESRWDLLYRILYRLQNENPQLMKISVDPDIHRALLLEKSVRRDIHKMHAFVRFKKTIIEGEEVYLAWHKPEHPIIRPGTPFFVRRFGDRKWSIFTPDGSAHWDLKELKFGPGLEQNEFQAQDDWDEVWKTYYKSIFNPARIKVKAMKAEMAPKYWSSLPEAELISDLVREAPHRLQKMALNQNKSAQIDFNLSLQELKQSAKSCQACPLYQQGTQTVFGLGPENAEIMIVGEQPGDQEDLAGLPFVGPAGEVLDEALKKVGIKREDLYLTNAVKHFKWVPRGKLRLHQKASGSEMHACKPWLEAEIAKVKPKVIVALGVSAGTALLGRLPKLTSERGKVFRDLSIAPAVILSWHPAAILRAPSEKDATERNLQLEEDINLAFQELKASNMKPQ